MYFTYLIFALTPILVWLFFYFKEDLHPEPKKMILKVFILGGLGACIATVLGIFVLKLLPETYFFETFFLIALIEEVIKYYVVKMYVFSSPELDEPLDVMLYMIISALGFAAIENILLFFATDHIYTLGTAFAIASLRFVGAVLLHTLTSGVFGFFIALSLYTKKNRKSIFYTGLLIATILHTTYNIAIVKLVDFWRFIVPALIMLFLISLAHFGFLKLKKARSICKVDLTQE